MFWIGLFLAGGLVLIVLLGSFFIQFNRDPERTIPTGPVIVAPADGKVLDVVEVQAGTPVDLPKGWLGRVKAMTTDLDAEPYYLVPIFMNPFNVHVQRIPFPGRVIQVRRWPGKFLMADSLDALENATVETLLETPVGKMKVLQTAGLLVRHIRNYLVAGQTVHRGERFGMIDFGSQVTILIPKKPGLELVIRKGDTVRGGETVFATLLSDGGKGGAHPSPDTTTP
ncbi:MAG: phosphatidylserine decarboxylase [Planctomycetes bacterium]|nr:phosphatidylserine decarboxylase [Planctomycetota bacterium]